MSVINQSIPSTMESPLSGPEDNGGVPALSERVRSLRLPSQEASGGGRARWLAWGLCTLFAASTAVLGYLLYSARNSEAAAAGSAAAKEETPSEGSAGVAASSGKIALTSKGYIIPRHQILVSPQVSGKIMKSNILEGTPVKKGDLLAQLDPEEYNHDVKRAEAMLASARHRLEELENGFRPEEISQTEKELAEAEAQLAQLESTWKRSKDLVKQRVLSDQDFEESESRYLASKRRMERLQFALKLMREGPRKEKIEAARADVRQAEAELAKAQWRLDKCTITAPIDGTILKKNAEEGNIVNPIAFNGSFSLCDLADLKDLEVEVTVQERDLSRVFEGQKCKLYAEAFPGRVYDGKARLMPIADRAKGAVPVRVTVLNIPSEEEGVYLKPEMGAIVSFLNEKVGRQPAARSLAAAKEKEKERGEAQGTRGEKQAASQRSPADSSRK